MKVRDCMSTAPVLSVREDDDLALASQVMLWAGVRHLPVLHGGHIVGVISQGDILRHEAQAGEQEGARHPVEAAMSQPAEVIPPEADLGEAAERMLQRRIDCLPVVQAGRLIGIITTTDLLRVQAKRRRAVFVTGPVVAADVMTRVPVTVRSDDPLTAAIARMAEHGIRHLPVVDEASRVIGILSDRDIRTAVGEPSRMRERLRRAGFTLRVSDAMTSPAMVAPQGEPLLELASALLDKRIGALPVVDDDGRLVGIVSYVDVLAVLQEQAAEIGAASSDAPTSGTPGPS